MSVRDRIRTAINYVFSGKQATSLSSVWSDGPQYPEVSFENNVRLGLRKNELIYSCIEITAGTSSQVHMQVVDKDGGKVDRDWET